MSSYEVKNANIEITKDYLEFLDLKNLNVIDISNDIDYEKFSLTKLSKINKRTRFNNR